jgi:hypothetical protein
MACSRFFIAGTKSPNSMVGVDINAEAVDRAGAHIQEA